MAFIATTIQKPMEGSKEPFSSPVQQDALMAALLLAAYGLLRSRKSLRRYRRQAVLALFKYRIRQSFERARNLFRKNAAESISNRTLLYILLAVAVVVLLLIEPIAAIVLLLLGILLVLLLK